MPITQDRMISLIQAALDYQNAFAKLREVVIGQERAARSQQTTYEHALKTLLFYTDSPSQFLERPIETTKTIAVEEHHFRTHGRDNRRAARRAEVRRRDSGVEPRFPTTIDDIMADMVERRERQRELEGKPRWSDLIYQDQPLSGGEDDPEKEGEFSIKQESSLTPHDIRRLDLLAAEGTQHETTVKAADTFENDLLICTCGFRGSFIQWQGHLTAQEGQS